MLLTFIFGWDSFLMLLGGIDVFVGGFFLLNIMETATTEDLMNIDSLMPAIVGFLSILIFVLAALGVLMS